MYLIGSRRYSAVPLVSAFMMFVIFSATFFAQAQSSEGLDGSGSTLAAAVGESVAGDVHLQSGSNIEITAPEDVTDWLLYPRLGDQNTKAGTLLVKSNKRWIVQVEDAEFDYTSTDSPPPKEMGYMTEYNLGDPPGYVIDPERLDSTLSVSATTEDEPREVDLSNPGDGTLATGDSTYDLPDKVQEVEVTFKQPTSWSDAVLHDEDHRYRIVVTFTISTTA